MTAAYHSHVWSTNLLCHNVNLVEASIESTTLRYVRPRCNSTPQALNCGTGTLNSLQTTICCYPNVELVLYYAAFRVS